MRVNATTRKEGPSFGTQAGFVRARTVLGCSGLGAMAIRPPAVKRGKIGSPSIDEQHNRGEGG